MCNILIDIYDLITGVHIASAPLKSGSVITIKHVAETTIAALTPRALMLCDLVGNALLPTHTHATPGILQNPSASYTSLCVNKVISIHLINNCGNLQLYGLEIQFFNE